MKPADKEVEEVLQRALTRHSNISEQEVQSAVGRLMETVQDEMPVVSQWKARSAPARRTGPGISFAMGAAAMAVIALIAFYLPLAVRKDVQQDASVFSGDGPLKVGEVVRSTDEASSVLSLPDGSRVEMRAKSQVSLEQAEDGLRIRLNSGSIIVNAAKQKNGHLYVQTPDVHVSVVGTVFFVNAEPAGSRVAVLEGEVHVDQGKSATTLRRGQQVATAPALESRSLAEEISWSRYAEAHLALLQQQPSKRPIAVNAPAETRVAFDVVSIRPTTLVHVGARGAGGANISSRPDGEPCGSPGFPEIDPGRLATRDTTLHRIIAWAYGKPCAFERGSDYIVGGLDWVKTDGFDVQAIMPEGAPAYTREQLQSGEAPELQKMLQTMLVERFNLAVHREMREVPAYALTVEPRGLKLANLTDEMLRQPAKPFIMPWKESHRKGTAVTGRIRDGQITSVISGRKVSLAELAQILSINTVRRPVLDRTGIGGDFTIFLEFTPLFPDVPMFTLNPNGTPGGASLFSVLEDLGLKLESTRAKVEFIVIDRAEKPLGN